MKSYIMVYIKPLLKNLDLIIALGYTSIFIGIWMLSELKGQTFFVAGEPNVYIRTIEWLLGLLSITLMSVRLNRELTKSPK